MKPQTSGASPGSRLGFAQLPGSKQPQPVGFNCCGCRTLCSGTQSGKLAFAPLVLSADKHERGSSVSKGQRVWMGVAGNLPGEFWRRWVCTRAKRVPGATPLTSVPHALFSIGSSFVFSPELIQPGIWFVLLLLQLLAGLAASIIPSVPGKPTREPVSRAL